MRVRNVQLEKFRWLPCSFPRIIDLKAFGDYVRRNLSRKESIESFHSDWEHSRVFLLHVSR